MTEKKDIPSNNYAEPEIQKDLHRPVGVPRPREIKSQYTQLNSEHQHGTDKSLKTEMAPKTGLGEAGRHKYYQK